MVHNDNLDINSLVKNVSETEKAIIELNGSLVELLPNSLCITERTEFAINLCNIRAYFHFLSCCTYCSMSTSVRT